MKFNRLIRGAIVGLMSLGAIAATIPAAHAELADILSAGTIKIGTTMDNPPFAYYDEAAIRLASISILAICWRRPWA